MARWSSSLACLAMLAWAVPAFADEPPVTLESLEWLAGHWRAEKDGVTMEEFWLPPEGGVMLGLHRDVFPDGRAFFEYLRIEQRAEGPVYLASPMGRPPTAFPLSELADSKVVFEKPDHDFPRRVVYQAGGPDTLRVSAEGVQNGAPRVEQWTWDRVP